MDKDFIKIFEYNYLKDENEINYSEFSIDGEDYIHIVNYLDLHSKTNKNKMLKYKYTSSKGMEDAVTIPVDNARCIDLRAIGEYGCIPALIDKYEYTFGDTEYSFTIERGDTDILVKGRNYVYLENKNSNTKYSIYYFSNYKEKYNSLLSPGVLAVHINDNETPAELYTLIDFGTHIRQQSLQISYNDLINYDLDKIIESVKNDTNRKNKSLDQELHAIYSFTHYDNYYMTNKTYTVPFIIGINGLYIPSHDHILNIMESVVRNINTKEIVKIVKTGYLKADSNKVSEPMRMKLN